MAGAELSETIQTSVPDSETLIGAIPEFSAEPADTRLQSLLDHSVMTLRNEHFTGRSRIARGIHDVLFTEQSTPEIPATPWLRTLLHIPRTQKTVTLNRNKTEAGETSVFITTRRDIPGEDVVTANPQMRWVQWDYRMTDAGAYLSSLSTGTSVISNVRTDETNGFATHRYHRETRYLIMHVAPDKIIFMNDYRDVYDDTGARVLQINTQDEFFPYSAQMPEGSVTRLEWDIRDGKQHLYSRSKDPADRPVIQAVAPVILKRFPQDASLLKIKARKYRVPRLAELPLSITDTSWNTLRADQEETAEEHSVRRALCIGKAHKLTLPYTFDPGPAEAYYNADTAFLIAQNRADLAMLADMRMNGRVVRMDFRLAVIPGNRGFEVTVKDRQDRELFTCRITNGRGYPFDQSPKLEYMLRGKSADVSLIGIGISDIKM